MGSLGSSALIVTLVLFLTACTGGADRQEKYFAKAQEHFEQGNFEKAEVNLRNVLHINENHADARYLVAQLHERKQDWKQVFANLNLAIELKPELVGARAKIGQMYYLNNLYDQALEQADAILALEPDNADGHALKGQVFYKTNRYEEAIAEAQQALAKEPGHVGAISVLSAIYQDEEPERALAIVSAGIEQQTENIMLRLLQISVLENQGNIDRAIISYKKLISDHPENLFFFYRLVKLYEKYDRVAEAESLLRDIVKARPEKVELKLWLAQFIANQHNTQLALETLNEFIEKEPNIYELRFALGEIYTALQQFENAEAAYRDVVKLDEEGAAAVQARNEIVNMLLRRNEQENAKQLLREILAIEPDNSPALTATARFDLQANNMQAAIPKLRTVLMNEPNSVDALLLLAKAHEMDGATALARDNFRDALALQPNNAIAILNVARLEIARGEFEAAEVLLERFIAVAPQNTEAQRLLVESYSKQGRWDEALTFADTIIGNEQSEALGRYLKGRIHFAQKDYKATINQLEQVHKLEPASGETLDYLVRAYIADDALAKAHELLVSQVSEYPQQARAHDLLGNVQLQQGKAEQAIASYRAAVRIEPTRIASVVKLGRTYAMVKDYAAAVQTYEQGLVTNPKAVTLLVLLGAEKERAGEYEAAATVYESALSVQPAALVAANNLAMILIDRIPDQKNIERASALIAPLQESNQPVFLDTSGWVHYKAGNYSRALPLLQRAVKSGEERAEYYYHLGMTQYRLDNFAAAKENLQSALADNSDFVGADEAATTLKSL